MSRWQPDSYVLGVALGGVALFSLAKGRSVQLAALPGKGYLPSPAAAAQADWEAIFASVFAQASTSVQGQLYVTLADDWVRYWVVSPPAGIRSFAELQELAKSRFESLFGAQAEHWSFQADWQADQGILVSAMPNKMLAALTQVCTARRLKLASVQPYLIKLVNRHARQIGSSSWVCVFGERGINTLLCEAGAVRHARRLSYARSTSLETLLAELDAELLRIGANAPQALCLMGRVPGWGQADVAGDMRVVCLGEMKSAGQEAKFSEMAYWPDAL